MPNEYYKITQEKNISNDKNVSYDILNMNYRKKFY